MKRMLLTIALLCCATSAVAQSAAGQSDADRLAGVHYARDMSFALAARERSPTLDRARDLAELLVPDVLPEPTMVATGDSAGWEDPEAGARWVNCHRELRNGVADYLRTVLSEEDSAELWQMLLPRAMTSIPADGAQSLGGSPMVRLSGGGLPLVIRERTIAPFAQRRLERAWQYLQNHRNGRAAMSAVSQYIESRLADGRGEAAICPTAYAQTR